MKPFFPIGPIGCLGASMELCFGGSAYEALVQDQPAHHAHREGAAAKSETEDFVAIIPIVATNEFVEIDDVALQPPSERATQNCEREEGRRPYAIIIEGHLIRTGKIQCFE